jgi:hypothetical protein
MGYAVVAFEGTLAARFFHRQRETGMLASLGRVTGWIVVGWAVLRLADIVLRGKLGLLFSFEMYGFFFWLEMALAIGGAGPVGRGGGCGSIPTLRQPSDGLV